MKIFFIVMSLFLFYTSCSSQMMATDRIHVKSGEIHQGIIIEQVPGNYLKLLKLPQKDTIDLLYVDVEKISKILSDEEINYGAATQDNFIARGPCFNCRKTYVMIFGAVGKVEEVMMAGGLSFGYNIKKFAQAGLGVQIFYTLLDNTDRIFMPVTLDLRHVFARSNSGRSSFLIGISPGYNISLFESKASFKQGNGLYISGSFGFRFNISSNFGLMLDLGYTGSGSAISDKATGEFIKNSWTHHPMVRGTVFF